MYIYVNIYIYVYTYTSYVHIYIYIHIHYVYIYIQIYIYIYVCWVFLKRMIHQSHGFQYYIMVIHDLDAKRGSCTPMT